MKKFLFIGFLLVSNFVLSQYKLAGKITDKNTGEPLAFVNIIINTGKVTATNINGDFSVISNEKITTIECRYVGYKNKKIAVNSSYVKLQLVSKDLQLEEFKVIAGENPAHRIIRKAVANRKINNPENLSSFQYKSYNKTRINMDSLSHISDSTIEDSNKMLRDIPLFLIESVAKKTFIFPDINEEIVIANHVTGLKMPSFSSVVTQFQPFAFYESTIKLLDKNYLNPISKGSTKKYLFRIEDTLFIEKDTTYILSYRPRKGKNFDGLKGLLYINTNKYAIQNVIAEPYEKAFISMKIQQKYSFEDKSHWFPEELNYQLIMENYPEKGIGTLINGEAFIDSVSIEPNLRRRDFSIVNFRIQDGANEKDSNYWLEKRKTPLTEKEKITFHLLDSLGEEYDFDSKFKFFEKLMTGKIPIKFMDIDLSKSLISNNYEGFRLGLGLSTNERLSKWFSVGGFFGYGLKDKEWKYGGDFTLFLNKKHELELKASHINTVDETAQTGLNKFRTVNFQANTYIGFQKDRIKTNRIELMFRALRYAKFNLSVSNSLLSTTYDYTYKGQDVTMGFINNSEVGIAMQYAYKEKLADNFNQRLSLGTSYPVLSIAYARGFKGLLDSELDYNKVEARIDASRFIKNLGQTNLRLQAGWIDKALPYNMQFSGFGVKTGDISVYIRNSFQTVTPYEFAMDKYAVAHFSHNFGSLLFKTEKFKPQFTIHQHVGFGSITNAQDHGIVEIKTMEKGFFESGLQIDNIVRVNYFNVAYLGLGAGVNYRYGAYHLPEMKDNIAFNISLILTTN